MAQQTEAACLLETGAMYGAPLLLRPGSGDPIFAGFKPGAFSLYFGDAPVVHFDREGRWQRRYLDDLHYLKGLDATARTVGRVREGVNLVLKRKTLGPAEALDVDERVRDAAVGLAEAIDAGRLERVAPPAGARPLGVEELREFLGRVARWDAAAWSAHRARYRDTYGPWPFLPPDCTSPVVLQATLYSESGHGFGCAPASAGPRARTPEEFAGHVRDVAALLGRGVGQCKAVFLGGPDVLSRPPGDVAAYLEAACATFPVDPSPGPRRPGPDGDGPQRLGGVHAMLDRFDPPLPGRDDWRRFRERGLVRVSLGVESGDPLVRGRYGKTWADGALRETVADLKAAGLGVGVVVLVGAGGGGGGGADEVRHLDATAALVNALELGPGDLVSLVDAVDLSGPDAPGLPRPLEGAALARHRDELKARLDPVRAVRKAKVVPYQPEKQRPG